MEMAEVFENPDLLKLVLRPPSNAIGVLAQREEILQAIREKQAMRTVNKLFNEICEGALEALMSFFRFCMETYERAADVIYAKMHLPTKLLNWDEILRSAHWADQVFDMDLRRARGEYSAELHFMLDQFARRRDPQTHNELADLLEKKCACCGKACALIAKDRADFTDNEYRPWIDNRQSFAAFAMHPYRGFSVARIDNVRVMMGTLLPYTHQNHFFEVSFVYDFSSMTFSMRLHVYAQMTSEELRFVRFLEGARTQPWYRKNVKRLFGLRDPSLFCEQKDNERKMFVAHICMFEPRFVDAKDWSVQSIFGLTRAEVLKTIRRGSAVQRERRLLH
tara:strand:+ start:565 stop:1569 length:1005 start_codon:yes stop_codon:yes gene_type:complete